MTERPDAALRGHCLFPEDGCLAAAGGRCTCRCCGMPDARAAAQETIKEIVERHLPCTCERDMGKIQHLDTDSEPCPRCTYAEDLVKDLECR